MSPQDQADNEPLCYLGTRACMDNHHVLLADFTVWLADGAAVNGHGRSGCRRAQGRATQVDRVGQCLTTITAGFVRGVRVAGRRRRTVAQNLKRPSASPRSTPVGVLLHRAATASSSAETSAKRIEEVFGLVQDVR